MTRTATDVQYLKCASLAVWVKSDSMIDPFIDKIWGYGGKERERKKEKKDQQEKKK